MNISSVTNFGQNRLCILSSFFIFHLSTNVSHGKYVFNFFPGGFLIDDCFSNRCDVFCLFRRVLVFVVSKMPSLCGNLPIFVRIIRCLLSKLMQGLESVFHCMCLGFILYEQSRSFCCVRSEPRSNSNDEILFKIHIQSNYSFRSMR
jgi:hypothetical protein